MADEIRVRATRVPSGAPAPIRITARWARPLAAVCEATWARSGARFEVVSVEGRPYVTHIHAIGSDDFCRSLRRLEGQPLGRLVAPARGLASWTEPEALRTFDRPAFLDRRRLAPMGIAQHADLDRIRAIALLNITHRGRFIGGLIGCRLMSERGFGRSARAAAQQVAERARAGFVRTWIDDQDRRPPAGSSSYLLLDADGAPIDESDGARRWLERPDIARRIARLARAFIADPAGRSDHFVGFGRIRFERLRGGEARLLCVLRAAQPHVPGPIAQLTPAQREVARLAAAGATVVEIARMVERRSTTVRDHLRQIYDRLEVSNRAELARMLSAAEAG